MPADLKSGFRCISSCSSALSIRGPLSTAAWFQEILPQIQREKWYGRPLVQTRQGPGEMVYIPARCFNAVYNEEASLSVEDEIFTVDSIEVAAAFGADQEDGFKKVLAEMDLARYNMARSQLMDTEEGKAAREFSSGANLGNQLKMMAGGG